MHTISYLQEMIAKANAVRNNAYAPISNFCVGACIRTLDNQFFVGCNVENASFSMTICAESVAIVNMISAGYKQIADIVIIASRVNECPPCGACRQRIYEFSTPQTKIYLCSQSGDTKKMFDIQDLLKEPFNIEHVKGLYKS